MSRDAGRRTAEGLVAMLRAESTRLAAAQAAQLESVAALAGWVRAELDLLDGPDARTPEEEAGVEAAVVDEVAVALGTSAPAAGRLVAMAERVTSVFGATLTALAAGQLDMGRVRALVDLTELMDADSARRVEAMVLPALGDGPWTGQSPRAWRERIGRAMVRVDADAVRRRREQAVSDRCVRAWSNGDGTGTLQAIGPVEDIIAIEQAINALADRLPDRCPDGSRYLVNQRRFDALTGLAHAVLTGAELPDWLGGEGQAGTATTRRGRDVGVVLHAETFFASGEGADEPGELRGLGAPTPLDPVTARELAGRDLAARGRLVALLADTDGTLRRVVRLGPAPAGGWTHAGVLAAVRAALRACRRCAPTGTSRARRSSSTPTRPTPGARLTTVPVPPIAATWTTTPPGPAARPPAGTSTHSVRSAPGRRHHDRKTRRRITTATGRDGTVTWTMLTGITMTTRPEPLPGCHHDPEQRTRRAA